MDKPCPSCGAVVHEDDFFCPQCGAKLKEKPPSITILTQILVYLLSVFLPPLGLWPAYKYLKQPDQKSKNIGIIAIVLTVIGTALTIWLSIGVLNSINQTLSGVSGLSNF